MHESDGNRLLLPACLPPSLPSPSLPPSLLPRPPSGRSLREAYDDLERERQGREQDAYAAEKKEAALEAKIKEVVMASFQVSHRTPLHCYSAPDS